ncbi:hypothetical protein BD410DRAFT_390221 [Rickenella mellea]|uniref:Uncharacterized protein n=1 Tax=Rickenella mellea TaxID=50990 RepID=A0A4Y7PY92_9AGAM|nr:hypothetical protein BD410DRAFT_390221 [Rickenella mellea]
MVRRSNVLQTPPQNVLMSGTPMARPAADADSVLLDRQWHVVSNLVQGMMVRNFGRGFLSSEGRSIL